MLRQTVTVATKSSTAKGHKNAVHDSGFFPSCLWKYTCGTEARPSFPMCICVCVCLTCVEAQNKRRLKGWRRVKLIQDSNEGDGLQASSW